MCGWAHDAVDGGVPPREVRHRPRVQVPIGSHDGRVVVVRVVRTLGHPTYPVRYLAQLLRLQ